ncbi:MAG: DNA mismatch repair protein MutL, partial [Acidobacteriia bacterium]|nr:DNA mismatch repair protein MutL [Terriglobia bacterium]
MGMPIGELSTGIGSENLPSSTGSDGGYGAFDLTAAPLPPQEQRFSFEPGSTFGSPAAPRVYPVMDWPGSHTGSYADAPATLPRPDEITDLKPLGQVSSSFIVAVNAQGLWIIDQHVAHERILFEQHLAARRAGKVESQRMLMPLMAELSPRQLAVFEKIAEELSANGFESSLMGPRTVAIQAVPAGVATSDAEQLLTEILDGIDRENAAISIDTLQAKIAASTACHAAIKVNMPLDQAKMDWLLAELARTDAPMSCPHGRPVVLRYSVKEIERAFHRI